MNSDDGVCSKIHKDIVICISGYDDEEVFLICGKSNTISNKKSLVHYENIIKNNYKKIEKQISKILYKIGFGNDLLGFECFKRTILEAVQLNKYKNKRYMTKIYNKTSAYLHRSKYIEADLRYSMGKYWRYNSEDLLKDTLGYKFNYQKDIPTSSEFIIAISEFIRNNWDD